MAGGWNKKYDGGKRPWSKKKGPFDTYRAASKWCDENDFWPFTDYFVKRIGYRYWVVG